MSKAPSEATQLRNLRGDFKVVAAERLKAERERDIWRGRATKAEQEAQEWKARFDLLLSKAELVKKGAE